jgi:hypothetical protein
MTDARLIPHPPHSVYLLSSTSNHAPSASLIYYWTVCLGHSLPCVKFPSHERLPRDRVHFTEVLGWKPPLVFYFPAGTASGGGSGCLLRSCVMLLLFVPMMLVGHSAHLTARSTSTTGAHGTPSDGVVAACHGCPAVVRPNSASQPRALHCHCLTANVASTARYLPLPILTTNAVCSFASACLTTACTSRQLLAPSPH